jgi:hypothetical protein
MDKHFQSDTGLGFTKSRHRGHTMTAVSMMLSGHIFMVSVAHCGNLYTWYKPRTYNDCGIYDAARTHTVFMVSVAHRGNLYTWYKPRTHNDRGINDAARTHIYGISGTPRELVYSVNSGHIVTAESMTQHGHIFTYQWHTVGTCIQCKQRTHSDRGIYDATRTHIYVSVAHRGNLYTVCKLRIHNDRDIVLIMIK